MDEFRVWWAGVVRGFLSWLKQVWDTVAYGLMSEWRVAWLIGGLGIILITGMFIVWRRKA